MNEDFDIESLGMGTPKGNYAGEFTPTVKRIIQQRLIAYPGRILHLYSGFSRIGDVRVDLDHKNATHNMDVRDFLFDCEEDFTWLILDPPYNLQQPKTENDYASIVPLSADVQGRRRLTEYATKHIKRILWLDICCPIFNPFKRVKLWFLLPGGYRAIRILSELENNGLNQESLKRFF